MLMTKLPFKSYTEKIWKEGGEKSIDVKVMEKFESISTNTYVTVLDPILRSIFCGMSPFNFYPNYRT